MIDDDRDAAVLTPPPEARRRNSSGDDTVAEDSAGAGGDHHGADTLVLDRRIDRGPEESAKFPTSRSDAPPTRGGQLPGYTLLGRIGSGGMGVVYQAIQQRLERIVAVKVMTPQKGAERESIERFKIEARALARLHHPNIVTAYDYGEAGGKLFIVLEYVEGMNCAEALEQHGPFSEDRAVSIARDAVLGLSHAHKAGIIHRDVKPANLILAAHPDLDASGGGFGSCAKVTDLGLACIGADGSSPDPNPGAVVGTPCYMAPEQGRGEAVDFRADIYALGASLYQLVTGKKPFAGRPFAEILAAKSTSKLPHPRSVAPSLSDDFVRVLDRMLAVKAADRYASYEALLGDLEALRVGESPATLALPAAASSFDRGPQATPWKRLRERARRRRSASLGLRLALTRPVVSVLTPLAFGLLCAVLGFLLAYLAVR